MNNEMKKWNNKQKELYKSFFDNEEESINICKLINSIKPRYEIWNSLYSLLINESMDKEFDRFSRIDSIKTYDKYIIIGITCFTFYVLDINEKRTLSFDELTPSLFNQLVDKHTKDYDKRMFDTLTLKGDSSKKIIDYIMNNKDVLTGPKSIYYGKKINNCDTFISVNIDKDDVLLGFRDFSSGNVNYITYNSNLEPMFVTNPNDNMDDIKSMSKSMPNIFIPLKVIPKGIIEKEKNKCIIKK